MENNQYQPEVIVSEQPLGVNVDEMQDGSANNTGDSATYLAQQDEVSFSLKKFSEYLLAALAIMVIVALIFGINTLGMLGLGIFFIYGYGLVALAAGKSVLKAYKKKDYALTIILSVTAGIILWVLFGILYIGYFIITLMLGFWELNS